METQYVYVKSRSQFGRQCIFDDSGVTIEENILPNPKLRANCIYKNRIDVAIQSTKQFAVHEVQTATVVLENRGMHHTEGGWPSEINIKDEEAVYRYRRRAETSDNWAPKMRPLLSMMEGYVLRNNTINIYEHYFDDMIPTELTLPLKVRTVNVYEDPQVPIRPVTHLAWSPDSGKRLAVSYCSMEFQRLSADLNPCSYIWNIENSDKPFMALKAAHPSTTIEFNPRDPSMLISGLMSGQVCNWDIRTGNTPIQVSHPQFSHRNPTNCALWINSKTNSEFFSASTGGSINWWDTRKLRQPTDSLIMDLENPLRGDVVKAIGVSALQFEPTMGTKFMAGMVNGVVVSGTRRGKNPAEKISHRFNCHYGPVVGIDRNPFSLKNFLTIGDWSAKIWAEDTKEGCLVSTRHHRTALTGGCWSTSRCSVFYVINDEGMMEVFDILVGLNKPVTTIRLCKDSLKALAPHEDGKLVAVGSDRGSVYLVESSEALTTNAKNDKFFLTSYLDRCSRYEKSIENRLKEIRLGQRVNYVESEPQLPAPAKDGGKGTTASKSDKEKKIEDKSSKTDEREKKELKQKRGKNAWELLGDPELADTERQYFEIVQQEMEKYAEASEAVGKDLETTLVTSRDATSIKRRKRDDSGVDKEVSSGGVNSKVGKNKEGRDGRINKSLEFVIVKRAPDSTTVDVDIKEDKAYEDGARGEIIDSSVMESEKIQTTEHRDDRRVDGGTSSLPQKRSLFSATPCDDEICEPKICCLDKTGSTVRIGNESAESTIHTEDLKMNAAIVEMLAGLPKNVLPSQLEDLPRYTADEKRQILAVKDAPPSVLSGVLKEAREGVSDWSEMIASRKFGRSALEKFRTIEDEVEKNVKLTETLIAPRKSRGESSLSTEPARKISKLTESPKKISKKTTRVEDPCRPITGTFQSKEILNIIGADVKLPGAPVSTKEKKIVKSRNALS